VAPTGLAAHAALAAFCATGTAGAAVPDTSALVTPVFAAGDKEYYDTYFQVTPKPGRTFPTLRALASVSSALPPSLPEL